MNAQTYSRVAGTFFLLAALVHVYRLAVGFPIQIGSYAVPHEASWFGVVAAGAMGWWGLRSRG